jgi:hypothetical protein
VITPIVLPWPLQSSLQAAARALLEPGDGSRVDFSRPTGEAALVSSDSVSWRVCKNPLSLFIGGVTAVIMELAEPRVRTGLWEHTTFRLNPIARLRRTGLAAMVTIYGARSTAEAMIARVWRIHDTVAGTTPTGEAYRASEPELLNWVQGTAAIVGSNGRIIAEDIRPEYLRNLRSRVRDLGLQNVAIGRGEPHDPRLPAGSVDIAILVHMYHEIAQPYALLYNLVPALRPDARVGIVDAFGPTSKHGTPPSLLRCVGYRQISLDRLTGSDTYLAVFAPPSVASRTRPEAMVACKTR